MSEIVSGGRFNVGLASLKWWSFAWWLLVEDAEDGKPLNETIDFELQREILSVNSIGERDLLPRVLSFSQELRNCHILRWRVLQHYNPHLRHHDPNRRANLHHFPSKVSSPVQRSEQELDDSQWPLATIVARRHGTDS